MRLSRPAPRLQFLVAMKTIRPLLPLIVLIVLAGCQTAKAPPSDLAGAHA